MPFTIVRQDLTQMKVDAIVNAANTSLLMGGGVCGAIFRAAGARELQEACDRLAPIRTGEAVITPGYRLPAKYVIHAAGPVYNHNDRKKCRELLSAAYTNSLKLAVENGCDSIAFPLISSGIFGYPKAEALEVATSAITKFLAESDGEEYDIDVYLAVFDKNSFRVSEHLLGEVASYIDEHYVDSHTMARRYRLDVEEEALRHAEQRPLLCGDLPKELEALIHPQASYEECRKYEDAIECEEELADTDGLTSVEPTGLTESAGKGATLATRKEVATLAGKKSSASLEDMIGNLDEPFADTLMRLIDSKGKTDVEVYKKANIDRKLFSKIRSIKGYTPKKSTILALAIALELSLEETDDLLERAGYALSHASKFDVIVEYFIVNKKYNIFEINEVLFEYDQSLLG